jgi:hypothetical protein
MVSHGRLLAPTLYADRRLTSQSPQNPTATAIGSWACNGSAQRTMPPTKPQSSTCSLPTDICSSDSGSVIAIHGLGTESPRTWEFDKKDGSGVVNWLADSDMLPSVVPKAAIYTYDWNANSFQNAPVQTLLGHSDNLLALVAAQHKSSGRPIIFIASCFGGLVLAEVRDGCR